MGDGRIFQGDAEPHGRLTEHEVRAQKEHRREDGVEEELHHGVVPREDALRLGEVLLHVGRGAVELLLLEVLAHVRFHDADARDVLLDALVEVIVLLEHAAEERHRFPHDEEQNRRERWNDAHKDPRKISAHDKRHHDGEDHHHGASHRHADDHHEGHLHVGDVRRHAGDERGRRELVDILEGEILYFVIEVLAQILGKARRGLCAEEAREHTADERGDGHRNEDAGILPDAEISLRTPELQGMFPETGPLHIAEEPRDEEREQTLQNHLERHEYGREDGGNLIFPDTLKKPLDQPITSVSQTTLFGKNLTCL